MAQIIKVPQLPWHGPRELDLTLPDGWDVEICRMAGYNREALTDEQIKAAMARPIGTLPIRKLARGKKEVVILVDDTSRVTRAFRIIPHILEELAAAGIHDENIRFISASGSHGVMNRLDYIAKLGESIVAKYMVYNHNPYENCTYVGTTARGTPISVNTEVMNCDFKIAVCSTFPHRLVGYSGAAKMIMPGVSHLDTIAANHLRLNPDEPAPGEPDQTVLYLDMEEAARLAGLDFIIEGVVNEWGETVALFTGDLREAHRASVNEAKTHYQAPTAREKDIIIANTFSKASEFAIGLQVAGSARSGGDMVIIGNSPVGIVVHFLSGTFGKTIGGRGQRAFPIPSHLNRLIVFCEYPDQAGLHWIADSPKRLLMSRWDDVLSTLQERHGDKASAVVYPSADIARIEFILQDK